MSPGSTRYSGIYHLRIETGSLRITRCIRYQCCTELTWNVTGKSTERRPSCEEFLFKENGKLLKLFRLVPRGLNLSGGSDTHQNIILWGIRPRRTRSCRVPNPAELSLAGYKTPQNKVRVVYIYSRCLFWGASPLIKFMLSIRPRRTESCGVSNSREQLLNMNISVNSKHN